MTTFVWLPVHGGKFVPVNVDRVAYVRTNRTGGTELIFEAFAGGVHDLPIDMTREEAVAAMGGPPPPLAPDPAAPARKPPAPLKST